MGFGYPRQFGWAAPTPFPEERSVSLLFIKQDFRDFLTNSRSLPD
jgi:hypothetical protein